jgi:hypothetical protein
LAIPSAERWNNQVKDVKAELLSLLLYSSIKVLALFFILLQSQQLEAKKPPGSCAWLQLQNTDSPSCQHIKGNQFVA